MADSKAKSVVRDLAERYPFILQRMKNDAMKMGLKPFIVQYLTQQDVVEGALGRKVTQRQMMKILKTGHEMARSGEI